MIETYKVYVQIDAKFRVTAVNSDAFLGNADGWVLIDEGSGYRYYHAQGNYLPKSLFEDRGLYRYKFENGKVVERTQEEIDADYEEPGNQNDELLARIASLEEELMAAKILLGVE